MTKLPAFFTSVSLAALLAACSPSTENSGSNSPAEDMTVSEAANDNSGDGSNDNSVDMTESERLNAWFEDVYEAGVERSPVTQTFLGRRTNYDQWNDLSPEFAEEGIRLAEANLATMLAEFDYDALDESAQISWRMFQRNVERQIEGRRWQDHGYIFTPRGGPHSFVASFLIGQHRVSTLEDAEAYIGRLNNVGDFLDQSMENAQRAYDMGVRTARWTYAPMIATTRNIITGYPFDDGPDSPIMADFRRKVEALEISEDEQASLISEAETALTGVLQPAYERMIAMFETMEAGASDDDGAWTMPDGGEYYAFMLAGYTTTDLTPEEIHNLGLSEVDRIHSEMTEIMREVGFEGSLQDFFEFMRTDPQFYYPNTDEGRDAYLADATQIIDTMREALPSVFNTFPQADIEVVRVEPFREASAGKAFYNRPAEDGSRPGRYYANLRDMGDMPTYQMEALAYHEGIPGHHMQLAIMQELEDIPSFRRFGGVTAYTEGWGLYSEYLPLEMGFYDDPYSNFGRLAMELWRACRLVVDTGLHHYRWTREEAMDYLSENTPNPRGDVENAINRYIVIPGQATAYKIGMNEILRLRGEAQDALGDDFTLGGFHDVVLRQGALPLSILEEQVNAWVEEVQAGE
ncbi:DUF885 domain-containing protein [Hyphobacterium sp. HN65]|uniref:DUF885 domain-containing protein n=1 Tax=Hyphobacterium lacteum TaxID=3116575 RepID=A0ABU7LQJ0_9PROT|nr:DUF885 domain-containing protein [Hyphobacterium sp. HN65]MEE2526176.1 DUF885 domain-containing protein [Hyphobacterium sp. HN65]